LIKSAGHVQETLANVAQVGGVIAKKIDLYKFLITL
jgi:hypothetical protein